MKNQFSRPKYYEHTITDENNKTIGTIRIKPSAILWKKKSAQMFKSIKLDDFAKLLDEEGKESKN